MARTTFPDFDLKVESFPPQIVSAVEVKRKLLQQLLARPVGLAKAETWKWVTSTLIVEGFPSLETFIRS